MSDITEDLSDIAGIIASLGKGVAEAQTAMNVDYVKRLKDLARIVADLAEEQKQDKDVMAIVETLAPPRYQFTQTTLDVSVDVTESRSRTTTGSVSFAAKAVAVNMAMSRAFDMDYRAAARITAVLHANPETEARKALLAAAKTFPDVIANLPEDKDRETVQVSQGKEIKALADAMKGGETAKTEGGKTAKTEGD